MFFFFVFVTDLRPFATPLKLDWRSTIRLPTKLATSFAILSVVANNLTTAFVTAKTVPKFETV